MHLSELILYYLVLKTKRGGYSPHSPPGSATVMHGKKFIIFNDL